MGQSQKPIDVICVCNADGEIRPLRLRLEDESSEYIRVDIEEILDTRKVRCPGAESMTYLCKATVRGHPRLLEIKYSVQSHCWSILWRFVRN